MTTIYIDDLKKADLLLKDAFIKGVTIQTVLTTAGSLTDKFNSFRYSIQIPGMFLSTYRQDRIDKFLKSLNMDPHFRNCSGCHWKIFSCLTDLAYFRGGEPQNIHNHLNRARKAADCEKGWRSGWALSRVAFRFCLTGDIKTASELILQGLMEAPYLTGRKYFFLDRTRIIEMIRSMLPAVIAMGFLQILRKEKIEESEVMLNRLKSYLTEEQRQAHGIIERLQFKDCRKLPTKTLINSIIFLMQRYKFMNFEEVEEFLAEQLIWLKPRPDNSPLITNKRRKLPLKVKKYIYPRNGD